MPKRVKEEKRPVAKIDFKPYGAERGKQYAEWDAQRKGTSYKQKLKIAIDRLIPISKGIDDLLRRLEAEGYEIKRGKYIFIPRSRSGAIHPCKDVG